MLGERFARTAPASLGKNVLLWQGFNQGPCVPGPTGMTYALELPIAAPACGAEKSVLHHRLIARHLSSPTSESFASA